MNKEDKRTWGVVLGILGAIFFFASGKQMLQARARLPQAALSHWIRYTFQRSLTVWGRFRLILGIALIVFGIVLILRNLEDVFRSRSKARMGSALRKLEQITDTDRLLDLSRNAWFPEVKKAAAKRRETLMFDLVEAGDTNAVRKELDRVICSYMSPYAQEFLARAAKKQPALVQEFWPRLQASAHSDCTNHTDKATGMHVDRTQYYDFYRYPDGRTVANRGGRKSHTDQRVAYGDCHSDAHTDSKAHTDEAHEEKIARFRPVMPDK